MISKRTNTRTRSGCLTCRDRHMKCDELLPICNNCRKSNRKCLRGIRLNFTQYIKYDPRTHGSTLSPNEYILPHRIVDQSITIASLYEEGWKQYQSYIGLHTKDELMEAESLFYNHSANKRFHEFKPSTTTLSDNLTRIPTQSEIQTSSMNFNSQIDYQSVRAKQQESYTTLINQNSFQLQTQDAIHYVPHQDQNSSTVPFIKTDNEKQKEMLKNYDNSQPDSFVNQNTQESTLNLNPKQHNFTFESNKLSEILIVQNFQALRLHWFFDLFNDFKFWENVIPRYCCKSNRHNDQLLKLSLKDCVSQGNYLHEQSNNNEPDPKDLSEKYFGKCGKYDKSEEDSLIWEMLKLQKDYLNQSNQNTYVSVLISISISLFNISIQLRRAEANYKKVKNYKSEFFNLSKDSTFNIVSRTAKEATADNVNDLQDYDSQSYESLHFRKLRELFLNQIQVFNDVSNKLQLDSFDPSQYQIILCSINSIIMIKYFISYYLSTLDILPINCLEIDFLRNPLKYEYHSSTKHGHQEQISDAQRLRWRLLSLIRDDYDRRNLYVNDANSIEPNFYDYDSNFPYTNNNTNTPFPIQNTNLNLSSSINFESLSVTSNERLLALSLFNECENKLKKPDNYKTSNNTIKTLMYNALHHQPREPLALNIKMQWTWLFEWALNFK